MPPHASVWLRPPLLCTVPPLTPSPAHFLPALPSVPPAEERGVMMNCVGAFLVPPSPSSLPHLFAKFLSLFCLIPESFPSVVKFHLSIIQARLHLLLFSSHSTKLIFQVTAALSQRALCTCWYVYEYMDVLKNFGKFLSHMKACHSCL